MVSLPLRLTAASLGLALALSASPAPVPLSFGSVALELPQAGGPAAGRGAAQAGRGKDRQQGDAALGRPKPPEPDMAEADRYFETCDYNSDGWISYHEASQSLEVDQVRFSAYDKNPRDGRITPEEFRATYSLTVKSLGAFRPPRPDPSRGKKVEEPAPLEPLEVPGPPPRSVIELFGRAEAQSDEEEELLPRPPRIVGPVPVFRRLDIDADGLISEGDLQDLRRPLQVPVRINAVLASLDSNQDGAISPEELSASMRGKRSAADG